MLKRRLMKAAVFLVCIVPAVSLAFGALAGTLSANPIKDITEWTGTWALRFLLITLCVTPLRKLTGWNDSHKYRRMLGLFAFVYAVLHFLTYVWLDQFFSIPTIVQDVYQRPFITVGFVGFAVMIPLALTSTKKWIARLGGRNWQFLHRLIYVSAIAGVLHYLWLVKVDTRRPLGYGLLLLMLLGFRVLKFVASNSQSRIPRAYAHAGITTNGSGDVTRPSSPGLQ